MPLPQFIKQTAAPTQQIALLPEAPLRRGDPILVLFKGSAGNGVLYVIDGVYISNILRQGVAYGAATVALEVPGCGSLDARGTFRAAAPAGSTVGRQPAAVPYAIKLKAGKGWIERDRSRWESIYVGGGVIDALCLPLCYCAFFEANRPLLRAAANGLKRGEFYLAYRPILNVATGGWSGVEALLRWKHPGWGEMSPASFISEIEGSALIGPLTQFVIRTALDECGAIGLPASTHVAINVAPRHLETRRFTHDVSSAIASSRYRFPVVLEVTERGLLNKSDAVDASFAALKAQNVKFAVDDFGSEYSNIDLLRRFQFDFFKVDRQFMEQAASGGEGLLAGICALCEPSWHNRYRRRRRTPGPA